VGFPPDNKNINRVIVICSNYRCIFYVYGGTLGVNPARHQAILHKSIPPEA